MNRTNRKRVFGTHDIARICEVTPPTVGRWIAEGKLPSFTTGGGHHRVWAKDLIQFLEKHNMDVPPDLKNAKNLRILVVDDDPTIRNLTDRVVSTYFPSAELHEAKDGFEAGHKVTLLIPSLIILDLRLPGINGIKVCEMVKQHESLKNIKVLVITGFGSKATRDRVSEAGADGFLEKPFTPEKLVEEIKKLVPAFNEKFSSGSVR